MFKNRHDADDKASVEKAAGLLERVVEIINAHGEERGRVDVAPRMDGQSYHMRLMPAPQPAAGKEPKKKKAAPAEEKGATAAQNDESSPGG